jgi:hypothetical protein
LKTGAIQTMFKRVLTYFREVRIKLDFPKYESECRTQHDAKAEKLHAISAMEEEARALASSIGLASDSLYKDSILNARFKISAFESKVSHLESLLNYLVRDYKHELDLLYEEIHALSDEKNKLHSERDLIGTKLHEALQRKNSAHKRVNSAKADISSWYAKSDRTPIFFGNSGKKLPKHAIFGQSFGDLDGYKSTRDFASREVMREGSIISELKSRQQIISERINRASQLIGLQVEKIEQVKKDRTRMFELKRQGVSVKGLRVELDESNHLLHLERAALDQLESMRKGQITAERYRRGLVNLEDAIHALREKKARFLKEFDLSANRDARIKQHRQIWLKDHGIEGQ